MDEGVHVEIFHNSDGCYLLFVLVFFLDYVSFGIRPLSVRFVKDFTTVGGLDLCSVLGSSFRKHLAILVSGAQPTTPQFDFEKNITHLPSRLEPFLLLPLFSPCLLLFRTLLFSLVETG